MEEEFGDIEGAEIIVDDLVVWERNDEEHDKRLEQVLERSLISGLKLNKKNASLALIASHMWVISFHRTALNSTPSELRQLLTC